MTPEYYRVHRNEILEKRRLQRISNKEAFNAQDKAKYQAHKEQIKTRVKAYYAANREKILERLKRQYWENVSGNRLKNRLRARKNKDSPRQQLSRKLWRTSKNGKLSMRKHWLKSKYGITLEQYEAMLTAQGGLCAICKQPNRRTSRWGTAEKHLQVDHCHNSKKVRGLLCYFCNVGLGFFQHSAERLSAASQYLDKC